MTNDEDRSVRCGECGGEVEDQPGAAAEDRLPCPSCGSLARRVALSLQGEVIVRSSLSLKAKEQGTGKPFMTGKFGASLFRRTGRWHILEQVVDRRDNRYKKRIVDEASGEVLRDDDGLLTDHRGFGDAKRRRTTGDQ